MTVNRATQVMESAPRRATRWWVTPFEVALLAVATGLMMWAYFDMLYVIIAWQPDYIRHAARAVMLADGGVILRPHFLYHALVAGVYRAFPVKIIEASFGVASASYGVTLMLLYFLVRSALKRRGRLMSLAAMGLALSLLLVSAVTLPTWHEQNLYWGYIVPHIYNNPTMMLLKPLALAAFFPIVRGLHVAKPKDSSPLWVVGTGILMLLATLAKPSFTLSILPAVGLVVLYRMARLQMIDWWTVMFGVFIPTLALLYWQYTFTFVDDTESSIIFVPFAYFMFHQATWLLPKFLLSIAFPLGVYTLFNRRARRSLLLNLAWLAFGFGALQTYLFEELGPRQGHGNFVWSGQITVFVLMVVSLLFLLRLCAEPDGWRRDWRFWVCMGIFALHTISGVYWFYVHAASIGLRYF